jgi:ribA/ribD-fused uncharacterized protein
MMFNWKKEHPNAIFFFGENNKYGEFSNFRKLNVPIVYEGKEYKTTEALYAALKYLHSESTDFDIEYAEHIRKQDTPFKAKIIGGGKIKRLDYQWVKPLNNIIAKYLGKVKIRKDWEEYKYEAMLICLRCKFKDPVFRKALLDTGDKVLCENSPYDDVWGIGKIGTGRNLLGKALMQVRSEINEELVKLERETFKIEVTDIKDPVLETDKSKESDRIAELK